MKVSYFLYGNIINHNVGFLQNALAAHASENAGWKNYYTTKTSGKWMVALDQYIICTFTRWYNKKHQRQNRMSRMGFVKNSLYKNGLKRMATA